MLAMAGETSPPSRAYQRQEEGSRTAVDEDIIALMRAGRPDEALARLVPAYRRRVFGLAYGILGDRAAAEDVAQEVFVKVWQAFDSFDGRAQLSTWIYAITRNAAISALRKRPRAVSMSEEAVATQVDALRADGDPEDAGDAQLWRLVETLPDKQRQAIVLFYQEDRSIEDIAGMLGMPVNTVKTHLHRGRARLAAALGTDKEAAA
jgi:RNA polymerase sigma-70 factor (ECF subfamily)